MLLRQELREVPTGFSRYPLKEFRKLIWFYLLYLLILRFLFNKHPPMDSKYIFETEIEVRDYEIDAEGIVNIAN